MRCEKIDTPLSHAPNDCGAVDAFHCRSDGRFELQSFVRPLSDGEICRGVVGQTGLSRPQGTLASMRWSMDSILLCCMLRLVRLGMFVDEEGS